MKVKVLENCVGVGYKLEKGQVVDLGKAIAEKLIKFGYVEKIEEEKPKPSTKKK